MILGWECIGCQSEYMIAKQFLGSPDIKCPDKCSECGGTVFRRMEKASLYSDAQKATGLPMKTEDLEDRSALDLAERVTSGDWLNNQDQDRLEDEFTIKLPPGEWMVSVEFEKFYGATVEWQVELGGKYNVIAIGHGKETGNWVTGGRGIGVTSVPHGVEAQIYLHILAVDGVLTKKKLKAERVK